MSRFSKAYGWSRSIVYSSLAFKSSNLVWSIPSINQLKDFGFNLKLSFLPVKRLEQDQIDAQLKLNNKKFVLFLSFSYDEYENRIFAMFKG